MKKTLAFLLVSVLLFALLPATALAATQSGTWGGIDWTLTDDGTLTTSPTTGTKSKRLLSKRALPLSVLLPRRALPILPVKW